MGGDGRGAGVEGGPGVTVCIRGRNCTSMQSEGWLWARQGGRIYCLCTDKGGTGSML